MGEVSWAKAEILDNSDKYVPGVIEAITDIIGEDLPVVDDELIEKVNQAFDLPNNTSYSLNSKNEVINFLERHKGMKTFTVNW